MESYRPVKDGEADELAAVSAVLRGNTQAFRLIAERYKRLLYRLSYTYLGNHEDAEESAQDILMRVFRYLHRFRLDRRFTPWVYGIAVNYLRTSYSRGRRREARRRAGEAQAPAAPGGDPAAILETAESRDGLRAAVARLPGTLREPTVLHYFEELRIAAIAEILQIGEGNVKSRLLRARRTLRRTLGEGATPP